MVSGLPMDKSAENRRRVKLYVLNSARHWDDRGTGHVSALFSERLSGMSLIVRDEQSQQVLLESKIDVETSYQKQQETLIVWSENESDMALSFQEKAGCEEVWGKICQVQGKDPSVEVTQDPLDDEDDEDSAGSLASYGPEPNSLANASVPLPPCDMSKLDKIQEVVQAYMSHPHQREKLAMAIEQEDYIRKLLDCFKKCDDVENTDGLRHLFSVMKNILMLNRNALYEILFSDECLEDVLGCLEWDPSGKAPRKHREYVRDIARFKEVVPLENTELYQKIQTMYRVQYIQDVILPSPSVFEENILNTLQSYVFFNKLEIVNLLQDDERFLKALFAQLCAPETSMEKRRDAVMFLKEFCQFSHTLQPTSREQFFRSLMAHGILQGVQAALDVEDQKTRSAIVDVFTILVEMHPFIVREYCITQANKEPIDSNLFYVHVIRQAVINDTDQQASGAMQILTITRLLLDPENMLTSSNKNEKSEFLNLFYRRCMPSVIEPILDITKDDILPAHENIRRVQILNLILEFLSYCVEHHTHHIRTFIINGDLLKHVLVLLQSSHRFLVIGVIRFLRKIIGLPGQEADFYHRYIGANDHLKPVIDVFLKNGRTYNLLNSAILELFEYIRAEDMRQLIVYIVGKYWESLKDVNYTTTFSLMKVRYEIHISPSPDSAARPSTPDNNGEVRSGPRGSAKERRFRRDDRSMDEDEEHWFDETDENENGDGESSKEEKGTPASEEEPSSSKYTPLTSVKSLAPINAAPPVKRTLLDDLEDEDGHFNGSTWKPGGRVNRKLPKKNSPVFKVSLNSAPDSTREVTTPPATSSNGPLFSNNSPSNNHTSSPPSGRSWEVTSTDTSKTPLPSLGKQSSLVSSTTFKSGAPSPSLVSYDDEDDEDETEGEAEGSNGTEGQTSEVNGEVPADRQQETVSTI